MFMMYSISNGNILNIYKAQLLRYQNITTTNKNQSIFFLFLFPAEANYTLHPIFARGRLRPRVLPASSWHRSVRPASVEATRPPAALPQRSGEGLPEREGEAKSLEMPSHFLLSVCIHSFQIYFVSFIFLIWLCCFLFNSFLQINALELLPGLL